MPFREDSRTSLSSPNVLRRFLSKTRIALLLAGALTLSCKSPSAQVPAPTSSVFQNPQRVTIEGYNGDAMEPFLSRDGKYLFFNNLNEPTVNTDMHWAERIDDLHFKYRGEIRNVNTPALEGVASVDRSGNFYFVSNRSYDKTASTLYRGKFANGSISDIDLVPGVSLAKPGIVNFDAEISADGDTLYFVESEFSWRGQPKSARVMAAHRSGRTFVRDPAGNSMFKNINNGDLNYAPATTASELEIFFTRMDGHSLAICWAKRVDKTQPFGTPVRLAAVTGFVEGPTLSPDEKSLYYHKKEDGHLVIYRVSRP